MKKHLYILILFGLMMHQLSAQPFADKKYYLVDSLDLTKLTPEDKILIENSLKVYHIAKHDTDKINALNNICENMIDESWYKYQFFQYRIIISAFKTKHSPLIIYHLNKSLADALNNIGFIFQKQGKISKALEYYHQSLKIQEKIKDKKGISGTLNNIAFIYDLQDNTQYALDYYHKSLEIKKEINDHKGVANVLNNIGRIYFFQGNLSRTLENYQNAIKIQEKIGDKKGMANALNNIGVIYYNQKDIINALMYYQKSLLIYEQIGDKAGLASSLNNIGYIELTKERLSSAIIYGNRSLALAKETGSPENIKRAADLLTKAFEKQGKGMEALEMYKLHIAMRDSINNEETQKAALQQQAKYEYEKQKAMDDAEHEKQLAIEQEAKAKQKVITYSIALGLVLVVLFLIFVFNRLQVTKKQKTIIVAQKQLVEQQKEAVEEAHALLEEKNSEIIASIRYAKRIQDALMTSQKYIERNINRLKN